jgi:molecular chaperone GrpE
MTDKNGQQQPEVDLLKNQILRLQADFDNAKKRWLKQGAEFQEMANKDVLARLIDIYDDFERALSAAKQDPSQFQAGVEMIAKRMGAFLKEYGVEPMNAKGKSFDPERHEAVAHEATESVEESTVLEELRKGYLLNGRVLRPSVVKVAVKPGESASEDDKNEEQA